MKIALHIERLVLDGLPISSAQAPRLRRAVERELARLLAAGGVVREAGAVASVPAPQFRFRRGEQAEEIGKRIAVATYRSLDGGATPGKRKSPRKVQP